MPPERQLPERATVRVGAPRVRGGRVLFHWQQDVPRWHQSRSRWFVHYHGVPLERMGRRVLFEVLLSLQLPLWAASARQVTVVLPEPVGRVSLEFWSAYHGVDNVRFEGPVDDTRRFVVPRVGPRRRLGRRVPSRPLAVTFGGGKDSTLALRALLRRRPPREVLLLHAVQLFRGEPGTHGRAALRSLLTVLGPRRLLRSPVQLVSTDFMAVLRRDRPGPRPHINLYVPAMLPALIHHDVHQVVFSRTALGYRLLPGRVGAEAFSNPTGRLERLERLRRYLVDVVGYDVHSESTHAAIGEYVSFASVARLFPDELDRLVMCTRAVGRERFCHACPKCLEFALLSLSEGHVAADLDLDRLLRHERVERIVALAGELDGRTARHGAGPYHRYLGTATHFATWCHALHRLDPEDSRLAVTEAARDNLRALKRAWGQRAFPAVERLDVRAVRAAGPLGQEVAAVAAEAFPLVDHDGREEEDHLLLVGDTAARFEHHAVMPTPRLDQWAERWAVPDAR
ncbi:hypothetical protein [Jannaschia sp. R86511]|uniref:hypothetical protein n=1 Tax=Jannaschia sp. R86511 TaxID=3093853 RepID=UPI0036D2D4BA